MNIARTSNVYSRKIYSNGVVVYFCNDQIHRSNGPAIITPEGSQYHFQNNRSHRSNGPAAISQRGHQEYAQNGELHRSNKPAIIKENNDHEYWTNGIPNSTLIKNLTPISPLEKMSLPLYMFVVTIQNIKVYNYLSVPKSHSSEPDIKFQINLIPYNTVSITTISTDPASTEDPAPTDPASDLASTE